MRSATFQSRRPRHDRRGNILVLSAFVSVGVFAFAAFTVDVGMITLVKSELQNAADGAARAAAQELSDPLVNGASPLATWFALEKARQAAIDVANDNPNGDQSGTSLNRYFDIQFGNYAYDSEAAEWSLQWGLPPYNAVRVFARRSTSRGSALPLAFAPVIGHQFADVTESAIAAMLPATGISSPGCIPAPTLPFSLDLDSWVELENNGGPDDYSWSETTGTVSAGGDGIPEIKMFPNGQDGSLPSGNRGTINIGSNSNGTSELVDQILNGIDCNDLSYHGGSLDFNDGPVVFSGNPGISNGMKSAMSSIIGQPRVIFLFTNVTGNGANTEYTVVRVVGVRVMAVNMTGAMSKRKVVIQPATIQHPSMIPGNASTSSYGTLLTPPRLVQ